MFGFLRHLFRRRVVVGQPFQDRDRWHERGDPPAGITPIESSLNLTPIPGTTLVVGTIARVFETAPGELVTADYAIGKALRCGHHVYSVHQVVSEGGIQPGIGGACDFCRLEAAAAAARNLIPVQQIEELSLYCTLCASHCDGCGRNNICVRHTRQFQAADGRILVLCPDCLRQAESERFFKRALAVISAPFCEPMRLPEAGRNSDHV